MAAECTCGHMLACGAYDRWWCPVHKDMRPAQYAVDAARELYAKYLAAANELFELKRTIGLPAVDSQTNPPADADGGA